MLKARAGNPRTSMQGHAVHKLLTGWKILTLDQQLKAANLPPGAQIATIAQCVANSANSTATF